MRLVVIEDSDKQFAPGRLFNYSPRPASAVSAALQDVELLLLITQDVKFYWTKNAIEAYITVCFPSSVNHLEAINRCDLSKQ